MKKLYNVFCEITHDGGGFFGICGVKPKPVHGLLGFIHQSAKFANTSFSICTPQAPQAESKISDKMSVMAGFMGFPRKCPQIIQPPASDYRPGFG